MRIPGKVAVRPWHIWLLAMLGSLVRLAFGVYSNAWMGAPDQVAWELGIEELFQHGDFSYKQLIHYPHEGGSFLISLVALCVKPVSFNFPALSVAALLVDTVSRAIQIKMVQRIFGLPAMWWFSVWTLFAVPSLLPWATVNFGLHSLAAFCPFIFIYLAIKHSGKPNDGIWCGLATGLSIWFAYDNLVLIPAFVLWKMFDAGNMKVKAVAVAKYLLVTLLAFLPHVALRLFADNGFHLEQLAPFSIRGVTWNTNVSDYFFQKILTVWEQHIPASFFIGSGGVFSMTLQRSMILVIFTSAVLILLFSKFRNHKNAILALLIIFIFTLAFAASPFYTEFTGEKGYMYYRYFTYIIPLMAVVVIYAFQQTGKLRFTLSASWILICVYFSVTFMNDVTPQKDISYRAAGWVLARKYGDQPVKLKSLQAVAPEDAKQELMIGFGWGLTATLLEGKTSSDINQVQHLHSLLIQFDTTDLQLVRTGINQAFEPGITPKLDPGLRDAIESRLPL